MIRLFVSDIDGCLSEPYKPFDRASLGLLAQFNAESRTLPHARQPSEAVAISICSGRSYPYVEAMTQLLGLHKPVLFSAGAGLFDPETTHCQWHPSFDEQTRQQVRDLVHYFESLIAGRSLQIDYAKQSHAGLVGSDPGELEWARVQIATYAEKHYPSFRTYSTPISVDVVPSYLNKRAGLEWLASILGLEMSEIAFVGDMDGDVDALKAVGRSYAPANAREDVKTVVDMVTPGRLTTGVLEAYQDVLDTNRNSSKRPPPHVV